MAARAFHRPKLACLHHLHLQQWALVRARRLRHREPLVIHVFVISTARRHVAISASGCPIRLGDDFTKLGELWIAGEQSLLVCDILIGNRS